MMNVDKRGRVRFTTNGIRYEINKHGVVRAYSRYSPFRNAERKLPVVVDGLNYEGRAKLDSAIRTIRYRMHQARMI